MARRNTPAGGKHTRPRRGFRTRSHYIERLRKRGITSKSVKMEDIDTLRRRQEKYIIDSPRIRGGIPAAPFVPMDAERKKGGKAHVG
jgi:hypothetical protein